MNADSLKTELEVLLAHKKPRVDIGTICVRERLLPDLIALCHPSSGVSHQACWCLEQSFLLFETNCHPYLKEICGLFPLEINHSGMRSLSKIGFLLCQSYYSKKQNPIKELLTMSMREQLVQCCFNQLLTAHGKSANLAFSTHALYLLGSEFEWIHPAMPAIIEEHIVNPANKGYRSVGGKILGKLT